MNFVRTCAEGATVREGLYCDEGATQTIDEYLTANGLVGTAQAPEDWGSVLVVYFSAQGHTEAVAGYIAEATGGDVFELIPVNEYTSEDLNWNDSGSRVVQEYEAKQEGTLEDVALTDTTADGWEDYDTVFIGYPIWWGIAAWPVNGFVTSNDFTGKNIVPFCTSSSSDLGESGNLLSDMAGEGNWLTWHRFRSSASESDVRDWLGDLGVI